MKKQMILSLSLLALAGIATGCSSNNSSTNPSSSQQSQDTTSSQTSNSTVTTKTLTGAYMSPANLSYMNARPTYNYYTTTFAFETLETYSDDTYCLTLSSTTYSALILPEEGNDITGNERENFVKKYYGTYTAETNDLDEDTLDVSLSVPSRITLNYDSQYFVDTANWTEDMSTATTAEGESATTAQSYLNDNAFSAMEISVTKTTNAFDYVSIEEGTESNVTLSSEDGGLEAAYISTGNLSYNNMRPNYNYYMTIMNQEQIELLDDNTYVVSIYSSDFSGLVLPEEGNTIQGSERANYVIKYFGDYTSATNDLDEDTLNITLKAPSRALFFYDASYVVDTDNWDDDAKTHTAVTDSSTGEVTTTYETGADYLATLAFEEQVVYATKTTYSFEYTQFTAQKY